MHTHACIKCATKYEDNEVDAYYCTECNKVRLQIAEDLDKKRANLPTERPMSALQEYDNAPKVRGFVITKL